MIARNWLVMNNLVDTLSMLVTINYSRSMNLTLIFFIKSISTVTDVIDKRNFCDIIPHLYHQVLSNWLNQTILGYFMYHIIWSKFKGPYGRTHLRKLWFKPCYIFSVSWRLWLYFWIWFDRGSRLDFEKASQRDMISLPFMTWINITSNFLFHLAYIIDAIKITYDIINSKQI